MTDRRGGEGEEGEEEEGSEIWKKTMLKSVWIALSETLAGIEGERVRRTGWCWGVEKRFEKGVGKGSERERGWEKEKEKEKERKRTAVKVPGKNTIVSPAIVFMATLSFLASRAMRLESSAMEMLVRLSAWAIRFWTFDPW